METWERGWGGGPGTRLGWRSGNEEVWERGGLGTRRSGNEAGNEAENEASLVLFSGHSTQLRVKVGVA